MENTVTTVSKLLKSKVLDIRELTADSFVIVMDRKAMAFKPGQHIVVGPNDAIERREYSIYSGMKDENLEILVKEVVDGNISKKLKNLKIGDDILVEGPFGYFVLNSHDMETKKFLFIASGTGVSPFHSYVRSYKKIKYNVLHGVSNIEDAYEKEDFDPRYYTVCTSKDTKGDFSGRVTDYLLQHPVKDLKNTLVYVCGNSNMIYDVFDILKKQGMQSDQFFTEVYF